MNPRATKAAEGFSARLIQHLYASSVIDHLVNRDYQGEINAVGSIVNVLTIGEADEQDYTGANLTPTSLTESNCQLVITKKKSYYLKDETIDNFVSYIKNPMPTAVTQVVARRKKHMEAFLLGFYGDVAAGNRVGTDVTAGTVTIDVDGVVTHSGTSFTSAMVGRGFKATGHSKWYRVKHYTSTSQIELEQDLDDETATYDGGVIAGGTAYTVEAVTPVTLTAGNIRAQLGKVKIKFDNAEVPDEDRNLFITTEVEDLITQGTNIILSVPAAYQDLVQAGFITTILGMKVFRTTNLTGDNTNGYHMIAAQRNWLTCAEQQLKAQMEEDLIGNFGAAFKDLFVYGAKVADARRKFGVELFAKV